MALQLNSRYARDVVSRLHPFANLAVRDENGPHIFAEGTGLYDYEADVFVASP